MTYDAILFDLDGTLLPMDYDEFSRGYFHLLSKAAAPYGYAKEPFLAAMMKGVGIMVKNDGSRKNAEAFWDIFGQILGKEVCDLIPTFDTFYETEFNKTAAFTQQNPLAKEAVLLAKEKAEKVVLATNPLFPISAVRSRLSWVGLAPEDFDYVTDYETSGFCKPNPAYFSEILDKLNVSPEKCLMIGNNVQEDIEASESAGLSAFLVTDCLISENGQLPDCPQGTFKELIDYLKTL